jgi:ZIP family zinc transporter
LSFGQTVLLGALAGLTIFLGLPFGRVQRLSQRTRVGLAMFAVGVLAFLFVDVLEHAFAIVEASVEALRAHRGSLGRAVALTALLSAGFTLGTAGLAVASARMAKARHTPPPLAGGAVDLQAFGEASAADAAARAARARTLWTGMTIAGAIGLHNFAEGLAIGVSASAGDISLATVLIIGFALHNATEGFGIVGPLGDVRPSWRWLIAAGLVGGAPTFLGTMVGYNVNSDALSLLFYAVSGGAILYVIGEVWNGMRRHGHREMGLALLALGFTAGIVTDLVVAYGGG